MLDFIPPERFFPYLTWKDVDEMPDKENVVLVQPVGAIEQHGHHLPLVVDSAIAQAVLGKAFSQLPARIPAYLLPPLYYGKSNEHARFPGTIALSAATLTAVLADVAESIYRAGFRKLVFANSHGGQPQVLEIVARDAHQKYEDLMLFPLFIFGAPHVAGELFDARELELGIHGGDVETSLMLSILPERVRVEKAVKEFPAGLPEDSLLSLEGKLPFAWLTHELTKSGSLGDATIASPEKGDRLLASLVEGWVRLLEDVYKFRQPKAGRPPL